MIGLANLITGTRAGLVVAVAVIGTGIATREAAATAAVVGAIGASMDLLDGWVARRTRTTTAFGARFDMEVDALLILVLSALVWRFDVTGPWILAAGLMRYAFVALAAVWPWLAAPLPPSRRRQTVCVVQIVSLLLALHPTTPVPFGALVAAAGLVALSWSFAVDVAWLHRARGR